MGLLSPSRARLHISEGRQNLHKREVAANKQPQMSTRDGPLHGNWAGLITPDHKKLVGLKFWQILQRHDLVCPDISCQYSGHENKASLLETCIISELEDDVSNDANLALVILQLLLKLRHKNYVVIISY